MCQVPIQVLGIPWWMHEMASILPLESPQSSWGRQMLNLWDPSGGVHCEGKRRVKATWWPGHFFTERKLFWLFVCLFVYLFFWQESLLWENGIWEEALRELRKTSPGDDNHRRSVPNGSAHTRLGSRCMLRLGATAGEHGWNEGGKAGGSAHVCRRDL